MVTVSLEKIPFDKFVSSGVDPKYCSKRDSRNSYLDLCMGKRGEGKMQGVVRRDMFISLSPSSLSRGRLGEL